MTERQPPSLAEVRAEMARLTGLLVRANQKYLEREERVEYLHRVGAPNFSGDLITVMNNDNLLNMYSGASKTLATLVTGFASAILAEVAYRDFTEKTAPPQSRTGSPAPPRRPEPSQATGHGASTRGERSDG